MKKNSLFKIICAGVSFLLAWASAMPIVFAGNITVSNDVSASVANGIVTIKSSGNIDQIRVDGSNVFVQSSGGSYTVTSTQDLAIILATGASETDACNSGTKTVTVTVSSGSPEVRFTPGTAACSVGGGSSSAPSSGGGGGGGGGGGYVPITTTSVKAPAPIVSVTPDVTSLTAQLLALRDQAKKMGLVTSETSSKKKFVKDFVLGSKTSSVKDLQKILICLYPDSKLAASGVSGYFGQLTQKLVQLYQKDSKIKPANGRIGPLTRSALNNGVGPCY